MRFSLIFFFCWVQTARGTGYLGRLCGLSSSLEFFQAPNSQPSGLISEIIKPWEWYWTRGFKGPFNLIMLTLCQMYFIYLICLSWVFRFYNGWSLHKVEEIVPVFILCYYAVHICSVVMLCFWGGQELAYLVTKEEYFFQSLCYCEKVMSELQFLLAFRCLLGLPSEYKPI